MANGNSASAFQGPRAPDVDARRPVDSPRPTTAVEWARLGQRQLQTGLLENATASFTSATELEPADAVHWLRLGSALAARWQYDKAETALRRACALEPGRTALHVALADVLMQQNKTGAAIEACQRAVAGDPGDIHAAVSEALLLPPVYAGSDDL